MEGDGEAVPSVPSISILSTAKLIISMAAGIRIRMLMRLIRTDDHRKGEHRALRFEQGERLMSTAAAIPAVKAIKAVFEETSVTISGGTFGEDDESGNIYGGGRVVDGASEKIMQHM